MIRCRPRTALVHVSNHTILASLACTQTLGIETFEDLAREAVRLEECGPYQHWKGQSRSYPWHRRQRVTGHHTLHIYVSIAIPVVAGHTRSWHEAPYSALTCSRRIRLRECAIARSRSKRDKITIQRNLHPHSGHPLSFLTRAHVG